MKIMEKFWDVLGLSDPGEYDDYIEEEEIETYEEKIEEKETEGLSEGEKNEEKEKEVVEKK